MHRASTAWRMPIIFIACDADIALWSWVATAALACAAFFTAFFRRNWNCGGGSRIRGASIRACEQPC